MRDPDRINSILKKLQKLWILYPDLRFMQLIFNLQEEYSLVNNNLGKIEDVLTGMRAYDHFYLEDDLFEKFLDMKIKEKQI